MSTKDSSHRTSRVEARYRNKRDVAQHTLSRWCGDTATWRRPEGGFFYWLELPHHVDTAAVMADAAAKGVVCRPGEVFFGAPEAGKHHVRLAFSAYPEADLEHGIEVLGDTLKRSSG